MTDPVMLLSQLHGEGRVTFRAVRAAGFYTLSSIAESPVQTLADRAHLSGRTARRLKTGAEEMINKGIGLDSPDNAAADAGKSAAGRAGRRGRRPFGLAGFSEGVLLAEAALLGQGGAAATSDPPEAIEAPDEHEEHEQSAQPAQHEQPELPEPPHPSITGSLDVGRRIAAAAEAAAGLSRQLAPASAELHPESPATIHPHRTFWGFG